MEKTILIICIFLVSLSNYGQDKNEFLKNIEWINQNPSNTDNKEFVSKSSNLMRFQILNYPNFQINVSGMEEIDVEIKEYKYKKYFQVLYSFNQLAYKLENVNKFNNLNACNYAMTKLIESYMKIIENEPSLKIEILDSYVEMNEKDLKRKMKRLL